MDRHKLVMDSCHVCGESMKKFAKNWKNGPRVRVCVADGKCTLEVQIAMDEGP